MRVLRVKPCTCEQQGPVVYESDGDGRYRVVCCYCWRQTVSKLTREKAKTEWNAGRAAKVETE